MFPIHYRQVSHHQMPDGFSGDDTVLRVDATGSIFPCLAEMSNPISETTVHNSRNPLQPPNMVNVDRMVSRARPIRPVLESFQTGTINSLVGFGAGAVGSWWFAVSLLNPWTMAAGIGVGAVTGISQYFTLHSAKTQDMLLRDIASVSQFYTDAIGAFDPEMEGHVFFLRRLCYSAGGVAYNRFCALDAVLREQGVCQNG